MVTEHLSAKGQIDGWMDASQIALDIGKFTKIKAYFKDRYRMTAEYGADNIEIIFEDLDDSHVKLTVNCDDREVLKWYKVCVKDVIKFPEKYSDYYEDLSDEESQEEKRVFKETPLNMEWLNKVKEKTDENEKLSKIAMLFSKTWFMILMLILLPPFGLFLFFKYHKTKTITKIITTAITILYFLFIWLGVLGINTGFGIGSIKNSFLNVKRMVTQWDTSEDDRVKPTQKIDTTEN